MKALLAFLFMALALGGCGQESRSPDNEPLVLPALY